MQFDDTGAHDQQGRAGKRIGGRRRNSLRPCGWLFLLLAMTWPPAMALAQDTVDAAHTQYTFDVPAQPLPEALQSYGEITGVAVLIDARLLGGLRSTALSGRYARRDALQRMLGGTGLAPHFVENGAFTLVPVGSVDADEVLPDATPMPAPSLPERTRQRGAQVIQHSLEQALCATALTRPGSYRASLRFWLTEPDRRIRAPELLASTGDPVRDAAIVRRVRDLPLPGLPADLPQPITLLLLPEATGATPPCRSR